MKVLFVSKPIAPPFRDGTKCLVRDVAQHLARAEPIVMSVAGAPPLEREGPGLDGRHVEAAAVYGGSGSFAPALADNVRAAAWLLLRSRADVWHFVFAPNARTSAVGRALRRLRRVPVVQTIASPPRAFDGIEKLLFGDVVVAQSRWTRDRVLAASGGSVRRVEVIPPPLGTVNRRPPEVVEAARRELSLPPAAPVLVYPGDLEVSAGAEVVAEAVEPIAREVPEAVVVFACRAKTPRAPVIQRGLERRLDPRRVRFAGEMTDVLALVQTSSAVLFPVDDLWGKVDLPIVLLEAMALGVPVVTLDEGPLRDLEGALRVPSGDVAALVAAVVRLVRDAGESARVVAAQRAAVEGRHAARVVARAYEALYEEIASVALARGSG